MSCGVASEEGPAGPNDVNSTSSQVNVTDLQEAEMEIIKHVQRIEFPYEIKSLQDIQEKAFCGSRRSDKEKKALLKKTSSLRMVDPVLDSDGVMRVGGRIRKANLPHTLKNPVILPKSSHISSNTDIIYNTDIISMPMFAACKVEMEQIILFMRNCRSAFVFRL